MPQDQTIAESAKQRSLRVPLGYLAEADGFSRAKWLAGIAMGGAASVYVAWLLLGTHSGNVHASPGRVSAAHAAWNDDCYACHASFRPLRSDAVDLVSLIKGETDVATRRTERDQACLKCHNVPAHHAREKARDVATCAACHREHSGATADILRPADSQCTACHADIEHHREGPNGLVPEIGTVTGFGPAPASGAASHPPFRSLQDDPGNIKFNHWLHLQPGVAVSDAKRKQRLSDMHPDEQEAYSQFAQADGLLQLDCSACHQPGEHGDLMRPIAYEQHCRGCHPLRVVLPGEKAESVELPHGASAEQFAIVIDGLLLKQRRSGLDPVLPTNEESGLEPLIPGKTLGKNLAQKLSQDVLQQRAKTLAAAAAKCAQCHDFNDAGGAPKEGDMRDVLPANVPSPWLVHARFDHSSHRHVECRTCHSEAFAFEQRDKPQVLSSGDLPTGYVRARDNEEVMIAGMESCATCHSPRSGSTGGARHDCAECHAYHGRDRAKELPMRAAPIVDMRQEARTTLVRLVSQSADERTGQSPFLGAASCAGAGCHGSVKQDAPAWQSAFDTWMSRDPHGQAYEVLWTVRGREISRLLSARDTGGDDPPQFTDAQHRQVLKQRCIGCHAAVPEEAWSTDHSFALGVECESCHGPADKWLHAHARAGFDRQTAGGFVDTKNLDDRAATCMPCHVGPNNAAGTPQVVDHDLIAAGHPRLNFEFHAYFQSLPAHWDRSQDEQRYAPSLHAELWLAGERKRSQSLQSFRDLQPNAPPDFALLDCAACHHALGTGDWRQLDGFSLPTAKQPLAELPVLPGEERIQWANELLSAVADPQRPATYDDAVRRYSAVRAVMHDFSMIEPVEARNSAVRVNSLLEDLGRYLALQCFGREEMDEAGSTQYELPANYDPAKLAERVRPVVAALAELEKRLAEPQRQP